MLKVGFSLLLETFSQEKYCHKIYFIVGGFFLGINANISEKEYNDQIIQ